MPRNGCQPYATIKTPKPSLIKVRIISPSSCTLELWKFSNLTFGGYLAGTTSVLFVGSSSWVLNPVFFWCSYSSRSWFCLVRRFAAPVRVWTCFSRVVVCGSSPWTLLVVAIEQVNTMQLFVWEAIVWLTSYARCHLMRPKIVNKSHSPYVLEITPAPLKERIP